MTHIKISGIVRPEDAELAASLGADLVACVFNAQSPRYVTIQQAWAIRRVLPRDVRLLGVFVDTPVPVVQQVAAACQLDGVQLFGGETRADVEGLGSIAFKGVTVDSPEALDLAVRQHVGRWHRRGETPALLLHLVGAVSVAWELVAGPAARAPIVLASSALTADLVGAAIAAARPWAVDVWEGVESGPGRLDPERLAQFIRAVREADAALPERPGKEAKG